MSTEQWDREFEIIMTKLKNDASLVGRSSGSVPTIYRTKEVVTKTGRRVRITYDLVRGTIVSKEYLDPDKSRGKEDVDAGRD